jgi:hypothetical protein
LNKTTLRTMASQAKCKMVALTVHTPAKSS